MPADNPAATARVLAEILDGEALRFPPGGPGAWVAWSGDGSVSIEIVERGHMIQIDGDQGNWRSAPIASRFSEAHVAICVDRPEAEIIAIAQKAGWTARHCERGGGFFSLAEVWVDNAFMMEFLDPAQTAVYKQRVTPGNWKTMLAEMGAA